MGHPVRNLAQKIKAPCGALLPGVRLENLLRLSWAAAGTSSATRIGSVSAGSHARAAFFFIFAALAGLGNHFDVGHVEGLLAG